MEFIKEFIAHLSLGEKPLSAITVKNYKADVTHFIRWFENYFDTRFDPDRVTPQIIDLYKKGKTISPRSLKRHLSSLRKFFSFLQKDGLFTPPLPAVNSWHIKEFKDFLYVSNLSSLTIKNYISDMHGFFVWAKKAKATDTIWDVTEQDLVSNLDETLIGEYKNRLLARNVAPTSINRKLSSLRRYLKWAASKGLVSQASFVIPNLVRNPGSIEMLKPASRPASPKLQRGEQGGQVQHDTRVQDDKETIQRYSSFPPFRLVQKTAKAGNLFIDTLLIVPLATLVEKSEAIWKRNGNRVFADLKPIPPRRGHSNNLKKSFYAPLSISTKYFPLHQKILHTVRFSRPNWYRKYHSYTVAHYFHFAMLIIVMSAAGFALYEGFFHQPQNQSVLALQTATSRFLPFQGRLTNSANEPITKTLQVGFAIYNSSTQGSLAPLWQEVEKVTPNENGVFAVILGKNAPLPQTIFSENPSLFLGVTIGSDLELAPRQPLATLAYANSSETLQGLAPITQPDAGTSNVILALDSANNLTISGSASPTFQATGGQFTLSGRSLLLTTTPGSNQDVRISPDGSGKIDLQKPIQNSTNNGSIATTQGAVQIDDLVAILATGSSQSALTVEQSGAGPIISASSSGTAKFTVENDGSAYFAGNIGVGVANPIAKVQVAGSVLPSTTKTHNLGSPSLYWNNLYVNSITTPPSGTFGYWQRTSASVVTPANTSDAINLGATSTSSALVHLAGTSGESSFITAGNFGIGTDSPGSVLGVKGGVAIGTFATTAAPSNGLIVSGNVGIGDSSPSNTLKIAGSLCVKSSVGSCAGNTAGTIYANNTTVQAADLAENYISSETLEPGDVVAQAVDGNNMAVIKSTSSYQPQVIGIVSTKPGFTLNSDATSDNAHPNIYPIGLAGRVPVKVSLENGPIVAGDYLTSSSVPGVAMKATRPGPVVGKALESFSCSSLVVSLSSEDQGPATNDQICQGKILAFVNVSWYDPDIYIKNSGNLSIVATRKSSSEPLHNANTIYRVETVLGETINRIGSFSEAFVAQLRVGILDAKEVVSPIAQIDQLHTNIITPLSADKDLVVRLASSSAIHNSEFIIQNSSGSAVATIDSTGNATFSGTLNSSQLTVDKNATISGTLRAGRIVADEIDGIAQNITNVTNIYSATPSAERLASSEIASSSAETNDLDAVDLTAYASPLISIENFEATFGKFNQGLIALGGTSLSDTSVSGQFSVSANLIILDSSIDVLNGDLSLQPLRQGGISFLSGLVRIDVEGNLSVVGNASFEKDVSIKGKLSTNVISPLPEQDLKIHLGGVHSATSEVLRSDSSDGGKLIVENASGSAVLSVNQLGDLVASGSAMIEKLKLHLPKEAIAISDTEILASGSAGIATISAQKQAITIQNDFVTEKSLIYITPRESTNNQVLFLQRLVPNASFTVGIDAKTTKDIPFNWLIVN